MPSTVPDPLAVPDGVGDGRAVYQLSTCSTTGVVYDRALQADKTLTSINI